MKKNAVSKCHLYTIFLFLLFFFNGYTQSTTDNRIQDSLIHKSYEELKAIYWGLMDTDTTKAELYINAQIKKAKLEKDSIKLIEGYRRMIYLNYGNFEGVVYSDSIIDYSKEWSHTDYPAYGYAFKGFCYHGLGKYKESLELLIYTLKIADKENSALIRDIKQGIAALKSRTGNHKEALKLSKEVLMNVQSEVDYKIEFQQEYSQALFNVTLSYIHLKYFKIAEHYCKLGISETLKLNDSISYYNFYSSLGEVKYHQQKYDEAIQIFKECLTKKSGYSLSNTYIFRGKSYWDKGITDLGLSDFRKADSIIQINQDFLPEILEVYGLLNKYYGKENNQEKQIEYIDKLIYADSVLDADAQYLSAEIKAKYDIPILLEERENIIIDLKRKNSSFSFWILGLSIALGISMLSGFYYVRKRKLDKARFDKIVNDQKTLVLESTSIPSKKAKMDIAQNIIDHILECLANFEKEQGYLQTGINLQGLAKTLDTNSNYLSKVINGHYHKNFSAYLSDLRVVYVLDQLQENSNFKRYTIKAIAEEVGFGNTESFTKAFYRKTDLYPSYFIKQLNKE